LREAYDNAPDSLQDTAANQAREEAASALEGLQEPTVPDSLSGLLVEQLRQRRYGKRGPSRSDTRDDAVEQLRVVVEFLEGREGDDEAAALCEELVTLCDEAEDVSFPGHYG
jgi:hypothetical protein